MHFDAEQPLLALRDLMATAPYLTQVNIGAPEAVDDDVVGWVALGAPGLIEVGRDGTPTEMSIELHCMLASFVRGAEEQAERMLSRYVPDMLTRLTWNGFGAVDGIEKNLNGTCARMERPRALHGPETYALRAGQEIRVYPISVLVTLTPNIE